MRVVAAQHVAAEAVLRIVHFAAPGHDEHARRADLLAWEQEEPRARHAAGKAEAGRAAARLSGLQLQVQLPLPAPGQRQDDAAVLCFEVKIGEAAVGSGGRPPVQGAKVHAALVRDIVQDLLQGQKVVGLAVRPARII